jgi:hypothetical protein
MMTLDKVMELVVLPVAGVAIISFLFFIQNCTFDGWSPRFFLSIERMIIFRPAQRPPRKDSPFLFGEVLVATKPLVNLRRDVISCVNASNGGMLAVCAPYGHGKTTTTMGAALALCDGMASRVLCISAIAPSLSSSRWYGSMKDVLKIERSTSPTNTIAQLLDPLLNDHIRTQNTKRLNIVGGIAGAGETMPFREYALLVLEDFSPPELVNMDNATVKQLRAELDQDAYHFLHSLANSVYNEGLVVVVSTQCKNTLRLLHAINGGSKAKMAPSTSSYTGPDPSDAVVVRDHIGLQWDADSRLELFAQKYPKVASDPQGYKLMENLAFDNSRNIRSCCEQLWAQPGARRRIVPPTLRNIFRDYIGDPFMRILSCQPFYDGAEQGGIQLINYVPPAVVV